MRLADLDPLGFRSARPSHPSRRKQPPQKEGLVVRHDWVGPGTEEDWRLRWISSYARPAGENLRRLADDLLHSEFLTGLKRRPRQLLSLPGLSRTNKRTSKSELGMSDPGKSVHFLVESKRTL